MRTALLYIGACLLALGALMVPLWPLGVGAVLGAAFFGRYFLAVLLGIVLDAVWGTPTGLLHFVYLPLTALALLASATRYFGAEYFLDRGNTDYL